MSAVKTRQSARHLGACPSVTVVLMLVALTAVCAQLGSAVLLLHGRRDLLDYIY